MRRILASTCAVLALAAGTAFAQAKATITAVPEIPFTTVPNFLKLPAGENLGESVAVATNSKGNVYVYHRRDTTRLFEFDKNGNFLREIGKGYYGFEFAHSVRVDKEDNIWTVDEGTNLVTKFSPQGKVLMVIGRRPPAIEGPVLAPAGPNPPAQKYILCRPSDVGFDPQGNIFISDGYCNNRVVKYDKNGRFVKQVGSRGPGPGQFNLIHAIAVDASDLRPGDRLEAKRGALHGGSNGAGIGDVVGDILAAVDAGENEIGQPRHDLAHRHHHARAIARRTGAHDGLCGIDPQEAKPSVSRGAAVHRRHGFRRPHDL